MKSAVISLILFATIISLFALFSLTVIYEYPPVWPDETVFADTAYELAFKGRLATPSWSYVAEGMGERAVWYPPVHFMLLAFVYKFFGFGILQTRLLSLFFGLVLVTALFLLSLKLTGGNRRVSLLVTGFLVIDPVFIRGAIIGRGDVIAVAFILVGLLCYLNSRKYMLAGLFMGLATLTQLVGVFGFFALFLLVIVDGYKSSTLKKRVLYLAVPFFILVSFWGAYALWDLDMFASQFSGQIGEKASTQVSDALFFLKFYVETYFLSSPAWFRNALMYQLILACFTVLFLVSIYYLLKDRFDHSSLVLTVFLFSQILAYILGRHGMWYNIYIQPFLYLSAGLIASKRYSLSNTGTRKSILKIALATSILILAIFYLTVDAILVEETLNLKSNYLEFSSDVLGKLPYGASVLVASTPDPYFVLKDSGKNLRLYTFVHMGSYPMDASYERILPEIDYYVFSGTPGRHYLTPYDIKLVNDFIRYNTTLHTFIGENKEYSAVIYKAKKR